MRRRHDGSGGGLQVFDWHLSGFCERLSISGLPAVFRSALDLNNDFAFQFSDWASAVGGFGPDNFVGRSFIEMSQQVTRNCEDPEMHTVACSRTVVQAFAEPE